MLMGSRLDSRERAMMNQFIEMTWFITPSL